MQQFSIAPNTAVYNVYVLRMALGTLWLHTFCLNRIPNQVLHIQCCHVNCGVAGATGSSGTPRVGVCDVGEAAALADALRGHDGELQVQVGLTYEQRPLHVATREVHREPHKAPDAAPE